MHLLLRLLVNAAALWVAVKLIPGLSYEGGFGLFLAVALIFGVLNASVRPLLQLLTLPLLILTLGLFTLVINGVMLWLTGAISDALDLGFHVAGFWPAFWGALVVSIVSLLLSMFVAGRQRTV